MKKTLVALAMAGVLTLRMNAIPAYPYPVAVTQPDGTTLTLQGHGDEFYNITTTQDGYTLEKNAAGYYVYVMERNGTLVPTDVVAHDPGDRTPGELAFLQGVSKRLTDRAAIAGARKAKQAEFAPQQKIENNYKNFRGLIILINYTDVQFMRSDVKDFYSHMFNDENYTGYTNEDGTPASDGKFTGSVRDFYYDNSNGIFAPQFDVAGPYTVSYKSTQGRNSSRGIFTEAVNAAYNAGVDMSRYDCDDDGTVDMVYFLVAGHGSNVTGNSSGLLWPHKSTLQARVGNYWIKLYASSTEMRGSENTNNLDGIGVVCHEFTHVLGFPDLYDTNYAEDGQSHHPGEWDVMASGGYLNNSRTPAGYSAFEKYALGFATPTRITAEGNYTLPKLGETHKSYMLPTYNNKEYFLLENRQKTCKWDAYLPGHGMLVVRVDSTKSWSNGVNTNPNHNLYELLRAGGSTQGSQSSDPFPGTANVFFLSNTTTANLKNWDGHHNDYVIYNIQENNNGVIHFSTLKEIHIQTDVEDFESMPVTAASGATGIEGNFATWNFTKCNVVTAADTLCNGVHAVSMKKPSAFAMNEMLDKDIYMVTAYVNNPTSTEAKFSITYSVDDGETWKTASPTDVKVEAKTERTCMWMVDAPAGARLRFNQIAGSTSKQVYVDDFTVYHNGDWVLKPGDVNMDGHVNVSDVTELVNMILGTVIMEPLLGDIDGNGSVNVSDITALINILLGK